MKKHLSKRLLSLFLAVMMVVTSAPFVATAASDDWNGDTVRYLFAYFTGDDSEKVRLAVSEDGFDFEALNGNNPVLNSEDVSAVYPNYAGSDTNDKYGHQYAPIPASGNARDPYIVADEDGEGYYILATDLYADSTNGQAYRNSKLLVWHIDNSEDFSQVSDIQPWNIETMMWFNNYVGSGYGGKNNAYPDFYAWAPGAIWDADKNMYLLYWTAGRAGDDRTTFIGDLNSNYNSMGIYGVYTPDFQTFYGEDGTTELTAADQAMLIYDPEDYSTIDAEIVYNEDDNRYYMWNKVETHEISSESKYLCYAVSDSITGPYNWEADFIDNDYRNSDEGGNMEGPFVYRLTDGRYVLMMDWYKNDSYSNCEFISYIGSNPVDFLHNDISDLNTINYLKPRHGKVCQISGEEYETLVQTYGKVTYSGQNYFPEIENSSINDDTLIARYFINDDINRDNTGNGYTLNSGNITVGFDDTRTYAHFNGGGESVNGDSSYAERSLSDMGNELNSKDGVTVSFYARNNSGNYNRRFFEFTTYSRGGWSANSQPGSYVNFCADSRVEIQANNHNGGHTQYGGGTAYSSEWHLYTMTISESFVTLSVDGILQKQTPNTPIYRSDFTDSVFEAITSGNLLIGCSSWSSDPMFAGDIYDFRIYNRALSNDEVQASLDELGSELYAGEELGINDHSSRDFYDPMEDINIDGVQYTSYGSDTFANDELGNVLYLKGSKIDAHYDFNPAQSDAGYTISFWYNPGEAIDGTIFNIGQYNSGGDSESKLSTKKYFALEESGRLWYCYNDGSGTQSYGDISNLFGSNDLTPNTWQNIVIQIVPNGNYEILYVYIDGELVNSFESYKSVDGSGNRTMTQDRTIIDYFANAANINSSTQNADDKIAVRYGFNYHANYGGQARGYIDDFSFYSKAYDAADIFADTSINHADTLIYDAIAEYEAKMNQIYSSEQGGEWLGGMIYTNMSDAYDIYDEVSRFLDATDPDKGDFHYDKQEMNAYLADYYVKLKTAINDMQPYETPEDIGGMTAAESGVNTPIDAQYTHNMLSAVDISRMSEWKGGTMQNDDDYATDKAGQNMSIASGSFVWMYTGKANDIPKAPINMGAYVNDCQPLVYYYAHYIYPTNSVLAMDGNWQMNGSSTVDWYYNNNSSNGIAYGNYDDGNYESTYLLCHGDLFGTDQSDGQSSGDWGYGSGVLTFTGSESDFNDNYYLAVEPVYNACMHTTWSNGAQHNSPNASDGSFWPQGDIYVINYARVAESLFNSETISVIKNVTDYTPDSVRDILKEYDDLTSTEYRFNTPSAEAVQTFTTSLQEKVEDLDSAVDLNEPVLKADDNTARTAVEEETPKFEEYTDTSSGAPEYLNFTESSWASYEEAYNALKYYYQGLNPKTDDQNYATDQMYIDSFASNLEAASAHLVEKADFTDVVTVTADDSQYTTNYNAGNGTNAEDQKYTFGTWYPFKTAYEDADAWADRSEQSVFANDTPMYELGFNKPFVSTGDADLIGKPYIALHLESDGSYTVVTTDELLADKDNIVYKYWAIEGFYENSGDTVATQFETGTWILFEGEWVNLESNGKVYRFAPTQTPVKDDTGYSEPQNSIINSADTVENTELVPVADYSAYNATTELLKYQDIAAFNDEYINETLGEVLETISEQGTQDASVTYASGLEDVNSVTCNTPVYESVSGENAYVVDPDGTVWKNTSSTNQAVLDSTTSIILQQLQIDNTTGDENRREVKVTYNYVVGDSGTETLVEEPTVYYGDSYTATAPEGYTVYKWVITDNKNGSVMTVPSADSYTAMVTDDTTITAYCSETPVENQVTLKIYNQYNHLVQEYNINSDVQITLSEDSYTVDGFDTVSALPAAPFYTFSNWTVNGSQVSENSFTASQYAVNGVINLKPVYVVDSSTYTVNVDGVPVDIDTPIVYDTLVTVAPADGAIGLAVKLNNSFYAVSYGTEDYSFYAVGNVNFYSIYEQDGTFTINSESITSDSDYETYRKLSERLPFVYSISSTKDNVYYTYSASTFDVPEGAVVTEVGTLYTVNASVANSDDFVIGADGVYAISAKNQLDNTMQYWLGINNSSNYQIFTRAYVKYSFNTEVNEGNVNQDTEIQTVDYGNICTSR